MNKNLASLIMSQVAGLRQSHRDMVASLLCGKGVPWLSPFRGAEGGQMRAGPERWSVITEPSTANMRY